jgi:hypothetical protein
MVHEIKVRIITWIQNPQKKWHTFFKSGLGRGKGFSN